MKYRKLLFGVIFALLVALPLAALVVTKVDAACPGSCDYPPAGRDYWRGYLTNRDLLSGSLPGDHGAVWQGAEAPWTVDSAQEFIDWMQPFLFDTSNGSVNNHAGAASYIVTAMLGYKGPDFNGNFLQGVNTARSRWADWQQLVRDYDNAGWVSWNAIQRDCTPYVQANLDYRYHDIYYFVQSVGGCSTEDVISFYNPNTGDRFTLKKICGNPVGNNSGLPPVTQPPTGDINPPTSGGGSVPDGYNTGNSAVNSSCAVISGHATDPKDTAYAVRVNITFSGGATGTVQATASTTSPYLYTVNTPAAVRSAIAPVQVSAVGVDSNGANFAITNSPITIGPCLLANVSCQGITVDPSAVDPSTPYQVTARVRYGSAAEATTAMSQPGARFYMTVTGPGVSDPRVSVTPLQYDGSGGVTAVASFPATNSTGSFVVWYGIESNVSFGKVNCLDGFTVANRPYFEVNGGDISAGAGMSIGGNECASVGGVGERQNASIVSWNRGASGGYGGAGTQYGALALNHLQAFATGQGSGLAPSGAAFANTGGSAGQINAAQQLYGGEFGGLSCTADFFENASSVQNGNVTINGRAIANGTRQTIYVDGNVYITGNITFSGSYASAADIPAFSIVVRGNIYIAPGVTRLDGFYIAEPSDATATNGVIYTCAPAPFTSASLNRNLSASCGTALTVNGAFVARQVWLLRTAGTVTTTPAETFNYTPEIWLSAPFGNGLNPGSTGEYDSITSLPPVL